MQRILDLFHRVRERINPKIAILVVIGIIGGVAVWQGFAHMAAKKPTGPTKQVATGAGAATHGGEVQQASAQIPDEQLPGSGGVAQLGTSYGDSPAQAPLNPYQVNPYATSAGSATTGSNKASPGGSRSNVYQPETAAAGPATPYRPGAASSASTPSAASPAAPPTSPYAPSTESPYAPAAEGTSDTSSEGAAIVDPVEAYTKRFSKSANAVTATTSDGDGSPSYAEQTADNQTAQPATTPAAPAETPPSRATTGSAGLITTPGYSLGAGAGRYGAGQLGGGPSRSPQMISSDDHSARVIATPGERQLEGPQQPAITIEKFAPAEIQVGKPATFEMIVRNVGSVPAQDVIVTDHIPARTQLAGVRPQPTQNSDGSLVWHLGTMQPGEEHTITLEVMPQDEGEIGSTAYVTFASQATSRSICTRPRLTIEHTAPPKVLIGESLTVGITVANPGTGPATGVMIEEDVPDGLSHLAGNQLEYEVGTLRPGESKRLELSLKAEKPGEIQNTIVVRGEGNLTSTHTVQIEVIAPQLQVDVAGPKTRFLNRQATYTVSIANPGTAPARDVELVASLPRGMKFIEADSQGQYDPATHAVFWSLEELPPTKAGSVRLTALPVEPGQQPLRVEGKADLGLAVAGEQVVQVEQSAELLHTVKDADEVIEVGSETTYLIKVSNVGTKAATNVRVAALLPREIEGLGGDGPSGRGAGDSGRVVFEPLAKLDPGEEVTYRVQARGVAAGDHIVRVQLASDEWPTPVTREESTRVYEDR